MQSKDTQYSSTHYTGENTIIEGYNPDIIITDGNHYPLLFIEVETDESVNQFSVKQWQRYAATDVPLYIAVPQDSVEKAKHLCQVNDIPAHLVFSY